VRRTLRPQVNVTEGEIDLTLKQMESVSGKTTYRLAEIFLPVPDDGAEEGAKKTLAGIVAELKKGTPFSALARQFSQAPGAAGGGDLGWMQEGRMDAQIEEAVSKMKPGQISTPVR